MKRTSSFLLTAGTFCLGLMLTVGCGQKRAPQPWIIAEEEPYPMADAEETEEAEALTEEEEDIFRSEAPAAEKAEAHADGDLTKAEKEQVLRRAGEAPVEGFDRIYADCHRSYRRQLAGKRRDRKPVDVSRLPEYSQLCAMGENAIAQLMRKMAEGGSLFALRLYEAMQTDATLKVSENEQPDARQRLTATVRLWLAHQEGAPVPAS